MKRKSAEFESVRRIVRMLADCVRGDTARGLSAEVDCVLHDGSTVWQPIRLASSDCGMACREIISDGIPDDAARTVVFLDCDDAGRTQTCRDRLAQAFPEGMESRRRVVVGVNMPAMPEFPRGYEGLAERELGYFLRNICLRTQAVDAYLEIEDFCRSLQTQKRASVTLIRLANVFSEENMSLPDLDLEKIVDSAFSSGRCDIGDDDEVSIALTSVSGACKACLSALGNDETIGRIIQHSDYATSSADVKRLLCRLFRDRIGCRVELAAGTLPRSKMPLTEVSGKFGLGSSESPFEIELARLVELRLGHVGLMTTPVHFAHAKRMELMQRAGLKILREIDRICRIEGIRYFIAGGTLLGQVRHGAPIVWDDDIDIGMLRPEFERFRQVVGRHLSPEFVYTSPYNGSGSHYLLDKIRLRDSWCSTRYSSANTFPDGVFADILVYDRTADHKVFRWLHCLALRALTFAAEVKWANKPLEGEHGLLSKVALPILRLIPFHVLHLLFDRAAAIFRNRRKSKYLIDTVGSKLRLGPLPNAGLDSVSYADFAGLRVPVPADPVPYLTFAYGRDYMNLPDVARRVPSHEFARVDLGRYAFPESEAADSPVNLKGELYENEVCNV